MKNRKGIMCVATCIMSLLLLSCSANNKDENVDVKKPSNENAAPNETENDNKTTDETGNDDKNNSENLGSNQLIASVFVPSGDYETKFSGTDMAPSILYIKGNGIAYQTIGATGKGPFIKVYLSSKDGLYEVYQNDLTEEEMKAPSKIDYLDKNNSTSKVQILSMPIEVGTRWSNKEIVEVGENLKVNNLTLKGAYVKTWEKEIDGNKNEIVKVFYYSEGLGCVEHRIMLNGEVVEESYLTSYEKK